MTAALVGAIDDALWWRDRVDVDPEAAMTHARRWMAASADTGELGVLARHVACLASVETGKFDEARTHARAGLLNACRAGFSRREAQIRLTLAWIELDAGAVEACRDELAAAEPHLTGTDLHRVACVRGLVHCQSDRYREAVVELTEALRCLEAEEHQRWAANALVGRALAYLYLNEFEAADADFAAAGRRFALEGRLERAAVCTHNRGCAAFRAGDLPRALRLHENALVQGLDVDAHPETRVDRAEALAAAGLNAEARAEMHRAADRLAALGRAVRLAETRLALAGCALRDGDAVAAIEAARQARRLFREQDRPAWAALATASLWQAKLLVGHRSWYAFTASWRAASACAEFGWSGVAAELRLAAGRAAHESGLPSVARRFWMRAAAGRDEIGATARQRAYGWVAQALLAQQDGDHEEVFTACRAGARVVDGHAAGMAAFEMRVHAFGLAGDLADIATGTALDSGDPTVVLRWTECHRAGALNLRALRPPNDRELRDALVDLRACVAELRDSRSGRPRELMARVAALEERVPSRHAGQRNHWRPSFTGRAWRGARGAR